MNKSILIKAIILILIAIVLGAFGAHALKANLSSENLASFEVGVRYLVYAGLGLLILGSWGKEQDQKLRWPSRLIFFGALLFSGSIFLLTTQEIFNSSLKFLGPITPIGGSLMIIGWAILLLNIIKGKP